MELTCSWCEAGSEWACECILEDSSSAGHLFRLYCCMYILMVCGLEEVSRTSVVELSGREFNSTVPS